MTRKEKASMYVCVRRQNYPREGLRRAKMTTTGQQRQMSRKLREHSAGRTMASVERVFAFVGFVLKNMGFGESKIQRDKPLS